MERGFDIVMMSWTTYVFNESTLVLEGVTLGEEVELVVEVLVDLAGGAVLDEKTTEDTETAHPDDLAIDIRISQRFLVPTMFPNASCSPCPA